MRRLLMQMTRQFFFPMHDWVRKKNIGSLMSHCLIGLGVGPHLPNPATSDLIFFFDELVDSFFQINFEFMF
jgi:hypothetical protein